MRKRYGIVTLFILFVLVGCTSRVPPHLGGTYQNDMVNGYVVQVTVHDEEKSFVEYISNREIDRGIVEAKENHTYRLKSDQQEFEIELTGADSFMLVIPRLNDGEPIEVKNIDKTPTYFTTEFEDEEEFQLFLEE